TDLCHTFIGRLFGHSGACSACGQSIPASEMVMRAQGSVYHLKCFTCATCRNRLVPGDRFHYINGTIFCEHDRPGAGLLSAHPTPLQANSMMSDQKVRGCVMLNFLQETVNKVSNQILLCIAQSHKTHFASEGFTICTGGDTLCP
ncbi:LIM domain transcription factor LMO4.1, partial [Nibea albiflora]